MSGNYFASGYLFIRLISTTQTLQKLTTLLGSLSLISFNFPLFFIICESKKLTFFLMIEGDKNNFNSIKT